MGRNGYGLTTLPYPYSLRASMITRESTHGYQR